MITHWINKIEVVERQIKGAVRLFFARGDIVVIHTIIASAHQILFDIGKKNGIVSSIKNTQALKEKKIQDFLKKINYPYNFFKHADNDADGKINIGPLERFTSDFIMDAIVMLQGINNNMPIEAKIFWFWFVSKYPEDFANCPDDSVIKKFQEYHLAEWDFDEITNFLCFYDVSQEVDKKID
jgi:hypothetical protein